MAPSSASRVVKQCKLTREEDSTYNLKSKREIARTSPRSTRDEADVEVVADIVEDGSWWCC
jgi:hypothetical protein